MLSPYLIFFVSLLLSYWMGYWRGRVTGRRDEAAKWRKTVVPEFEALVKERDGLSYDNRIKTAKINRLRRQK